MPDLLHEYWDDEEQAMGMFGPVSVHADRDRAASNPNARLLFSLSNALKLCPARATTRCL